MPSVHGVALSPWSHHAAYWPGHSCQLWSSPVHPVSLRCRLCPCARGFFCPITASWSSFECPCMLTISVDSVFNVQVVVFRSLFHVQRPRPLAVYPDGWTSWKRCVPRMVRLSSGQLSLFPLRWLYDNIPPTSCQHLIFQKIYIFEFLCSDFVCLCNGIGIDWMIDRFFVEKFVRKKRFFIHFQKNKKRFSFHYRQKIRIFRRYLLKYYQSIYFQENNKIDNILSISFPVCLGVHGWDVR